ncbi:fungal-specific transcription factor domain-containing protein [Amylocarpus encephaloides]|uniref:Fungal-specific transcription factor domain-containing protein n=1 Tax=Amylocarpus encephaloides TaxID=45428 RepID=A0A9P7YT67_9HELO|nr:fungal-specific transcription factor domain-containing protein [Amylocarpus encephaloides]
MVNSQRQGRSQGRSQDEEVHTSFTAQTVQNGQRKKYDCKHENCDKSFSRSDHLQRHTLNHSTGSSTCPRCSLHFQRPDLLDRHMDRHKQKDDEAGGYGLGVMETRKRLWRDSEGNIVTKRPTLPKNNPVATSLQNNQCSENQQQGNINNNGYNLHQVREPLSPPRSMISLDLKGGRHQQMSVTNALEDQWCPDPMPSFSNDVPDMCEFLANSSWGSQPSQNSLGIGRVDNDMFNPDTASSFNMPFTTMNNYNWLFDVNGLEQDLRVPVGGGLQNRFQSIENQRLYGTLNNSHYRQPLVQDGLGTSDLSLPVQSGQFLEPPTQINSMQTAYPRQGHMSATSFPATTSITSQSLSLEGGASSRNISGQYTTTSQTTVSDYQQPPRPRAALSRPDPVSGSDPLQTFSPSSPSMYMPTVDEVSRNQILYFIVQAGPKTPEGLPIARDHPLLSLSALQNYCDLFFCRFNVAYPLLHQATFDPSQVETLLLISVLLLGATYGDKASHRLAVCIHDVLRAQIFQNTAFRAQPELWMLQTILLVECFGKSRAGQTQHDMAHLFHGLLINLIRRSNCQTVQQLNLHDDERNLEADWRRFVDIEQRKRLALLCFLWDTQHAVLFSQSLCMSAFELRLSLPCNPTTWQADSAEDWYNHFKKETETSFLTVLKIYMNPGSATPPAHLNALSRLLILHGLMSISWDMKRRDQTSLCFVGPTAQDRQNRLAESYNTWKADFDTYSMSMALSLKDNATLRKEFTQFNTASIAIYHAAHIILNVEILDLQIYAGARHIIGRPVTRVDYDRSRRILMQWAKPGSSTAAIKASWHAAHLLRDGIINLEDWDVNDVFHYPWCLYLATLTCWGFHFAGSDKNDHANRPVDAMQHDDIVWDSLTEMNSLVSSMTSVTPEGLWRMVGKYPTSGLTAVIAKHLSSVRWAVVHEGMKVLRGLVAERRINEYESLLK